jgi:hypothetical protein
MNVEDRKSTSCRASCGTSAAGVAADVIRSSRGGVASVKLLAHGIMIGANG